MTASPDKAKADVAIIGAGIIGVTTALALAERGLPVTLIDRTGIGEETSSGNAGGFAFSSVLPVASPGIVFKAPKWLFDPTGPLSVPPSYLPKVAPWLWRFFLASRPARYRGSIEAQAALMRLSLAETEALLGRTGLTQTVSRHGALHLYDSEKSFDAAKAGWQTSGENGVAFTHLDRAGIDEKQPGLTAHFTRATFTPEWWNIDDPKAYTKALGERAIAKGATFRKALVAALQPSDTGVEIALETGERLQADKVVIAAGAWSHRLAATIGDNIPLETERGYNTTLPPGAFDLKCQLVFDDHGFVVSPLSIGVRVGGAVELGGLERAPNFQRSKAMLKKAARFMPGLKTEAGKEWMGYRPSIPDSLPVIGASATTRHVIHAFGHGHLGLTQSAATARLVADLVTGETPAISLAPYSPDRF